MNEAELDIYHDVLSALTNHIGGIWKVYPYEYNQPNDEPGKKELIIKKIQEVYYKATPVVYKEFREQNLIKLLDRFLSGEKEKIVVVAMKIHSKAKILLKERNIDYVDGAGNALLHYSFDNQNPDYWNFFVEIEGKKVKEDDKDVPNRAFTKSGLRFLFHVLHDPDLINANYRKISETAQVAMGSIKYMINGLVKEAFLFRKNDKTYKINRKEELQDRWIDAYGERLKPSLAIGKFRFLNPDDFKNWQDLSIDGITTWWGGEPAGALYTGYLKPEILTIYTTETRNDLIKKYKLVPDPNGNIHCFQKFWNVEGISQNVVSPLLTYADLILTRDERCIETALKINERYLKENI